jgi:SAM-dependent methyltransferase
MEMLTAYQRSDTLMAAIELDLFSHIAQGHATSASIASRCGATERGVRILCDCLVVEGLASKNADGLYALEPDAARFLDRESRAYLGSAMRFLSAPPIREGFSRLADAARKGGTAVDEEGTLAPEHDVWVEFAQGMAPLMAPTAAALAEQLHADGIGAERVLDLAAGHGLFGIEVIRRNPSARVVAADWPGVLDVAAENARRRNVADRFDVLPGDIFASEFGTGFDLVLMANILHHFDADRCTSLLRKVHDALAPGGRMVAVEYAPNDDRVSPPRSAAFAAVMLATTPSGDAYTFAEYRDMLAGAGFAPEQAAMNDLAGSMHRVIIAER